MALDERYLPHPTTYDSSEDPAGSVDPLGTLPLAERLADVLLPGLTARMWRPRLLTYVALASLIAERVDGRDEGGDVWLEARLAFERIFVSALARQLESKEGDNNWDEATALLPGKRLAQRAVKNHDTPLGRHNFLKGQAANGPFGVMARLARELDIVRKEDDRLGKNGWTLLAKWAEERGIPFASLLPETGEQSADTEWLERYVRATAHHREGNWRTRNWEGWRELANTLRLDGAGREEKKFLRELLAQNPVRMRFLELLQQRDVRKAYGDAKRLGSREQERSALRKMRTLTKSKRGPDRVIHDASLIITSYENVASLLEVAFDTVRWGVQHGEGHVTTSSISKDMAKSLNRISSELCRAAKDLNRNLEHLAELRENGFPDGAAGELAEFVELVEECEKPERLIDTLLKLHHQVQQRRGRGMWVSRSGHAGVLAVMPGYGYPGKEPPDIRRRFIHTFRIPNAYSFLHDLGRKGFKPGAAAEDEHEQET